LVYPLWSAWACSIVACARGATIIEPKPLSRLSRDRLFALNYGLLIANALPTFVSESLLTKGVTGAALNLFDISAIVWLAIIACLALLWNSGNDAAPDHKDWVLTTLIICASLLPSPAISGAMLSLLGLWGLIASPAGSTVLRASAILISLSTFLLWGRVFLALGAGPMLAADAQFLSWISGLSVSGNIVTASDGSTFVIAPGCSSLHNISLAIILWVTAIAWFERPVTIRLLGLLTLTVVASILVNAVRLALIGWNPRSFDYWHIGDGAAMIGWAALIVMTGIIYTGMKYELAKT
jgi:exosortase/archaeosortase family protein